MKSKILDQMSGTHTTQDLDEKEHVGGNFFVREREVRYDSGAFSSDSDILPNCEWAITLQLLDQNTLELLIKFIALALFMWYPALISWKTNQTKHCIAAIYSYGFLFNLVHFSIKSKHDMHVSEVTVTWENRRKQTTKQCHKKLQTNIQIRK